MRTITARTSHENSSCSKRNFKWIIRKSNIGGCSGRKQWEEEEEKEVPPFSLSSSEAATAAGFKKKTSSAAVTVSRFRSVLTAAVTSSSRQNRSAARMTGTLYGNRCGHVHLALQVDSRACPVVLLELAMLTSVLVREMASGLVRIALECQRRAGGGGKGTEAAAKKLMEESLWRAYCNGRKCGYALRRECRPADWKVLKAVEPVSMGAGVLPVGNAGEGPDGEMMYMRATFERVTGSKDSEAFYMMSPDSSNGGTELSIYFLRV